MRQINRRRVISAVTILAYVAAAIGFPMPATASNDRTARGQRVCCCGSEAKCRASGCGCSHAPLPVPVGKSGEKIPGNECCSTHSRPTKSVQSTRSCCSRSSDTTKPVESDSIVPPKPKPKPLRWVVGISALKCQSGASKWISIQAALPGPEPLNWQPSWPYSHTLFILQEHPFFVDNAPLDPPPR
jgi:hypothetical protein